MGKGRPRAVEKGVSGHCPSTSPLGALNVPQAPVYYPTEDEFNNPLDFIEKIRPEAESYGICRIVPPKSWKPPFALDLESFTFPTKSQAIHQLQTRAASCDPKTFELEYNCFLEKHIGRRPKKKAVFEGQELDLCKLFNAVKRYGGYDKVVKDKKWGDVFRFVCSVGKISECSKHVLSQLYREHLFDYEEYISKLNHENKSKNYKRVRDDRKIEGQAPIVNDVKRRRKNSKGEKIKVAKVVKKEEYDQICEQCKSGLHGEVMLLCDRCDKGWHLYCLSPPLEKVPSGNWYCLECVNSNKDSFGFIPGKHFTLEAFRRLADRAKRKWFGTMSATRAQIEKKFWEIVEGSAGEVEVMYGSDLDTSIYGSGFPHIGDPLPASVEPDEWRKYSCSPWNLNNLPKLEGSMLRAVHDNIAGIMVPWLYIGMLFSSFCWHFEDHCFYSMNYLHWGEPKCWYSVPGGEAQSFELIMRKTLPDLFDVQPDLLFQLVTMLNPTVLQDNGVPVYGVLQEPGNFVVTFPRSFHGGFNFGLNCAEAVNFAPADWLPHGGYGADLYRLYHKAAVLSHEELLCVVAKGTSDKKVQLYLEAELQRIFAKEKRCREQLWRSGISKSSPMSPRKHPEYVGTEEDPMCIICHQYLYLSAVVCSCRPTAFVCLEHWEHLCECKAQKHQLLYRHSLADLEDLLFTVTSESSSSCMLEEKPLNQFSCFIEPDFATKKVNGGFATFAQLVEDWLSSSSIILQIPFSDSSYTKALKEAERFLWAGHEVDLVRNLARSLAEAQKWAIGVRNCLFKIESRICNREVEGKVALSEVENFLSVDPAPCNEPGLAKLKVYAEEASMLLSQIKSALSSHLHISELELLFSRVVESPIFIEETIRLVREISSAKVWISSVKECLEPKSVLVEVDVLYKLKVEMTELSSKLPEMELLSNLLRQVESWQTRCAELLNGQITLQDLEVFLQDADCINVNTPELKLLRQYHSDALSWICRFTDVLVKIPEREDHKNVVVELTCLMEEGSSLRIQVDELSVLKAELRKSMCREKAVEALSTKMPLQVIQELVKEAASLKIESEEVFVNIFKVLEAAYSWEEKAKNVLSDCGQMSEFEDCIRLAENIFVVLPSLQELKDAVSVAESWRQESEPFLMSTIHSKHASNCLLNVDALKELVCRSKHLKVSLGDSETLQSILGNIEGWECEFYSLLKHVNSLFDMNEMFRSIKCGDSAGIMNLMSKVTSLLEVGRSLGFALPDLPKLQNILSTLRWCLKALTLSYATVSFQVDKLIEEAGHLPEAYESSIFVSALIDGVKWMKQASMVTSKSSTVKRYKLSDVEALLKEAQRIKIPLSAMVTELVTVIEKHKSWQQKVNEFFSSSGKQLWPLLLELKDLGESDALDSMELHKVTSETAKVDKWIMRCKDLVVPITGDLGSLSLALTKIKNTLDRSLCIIGESESCRSMVFCLCFSSNPEHDILACSTCKNWYHLSCVGPSLAIGSGVKEYICPFCLCMDGGSISGKSGWHLLSRRNRPRLKMFVELLHDAKNLYEGIEERDLVEELVERSLACKLHLADTVDNVLSHTQKDLCCTSKRLLVTLKVAAMAGVYDHEGSCNLLLALTRHSWKLRVIKLLEGSNKPSIEQILHLLDEGTAINISSQDYYMKKLTEVKHLGLQWASLAKKVASDSERLELDRIFNLIREGENLPIYFEKELKLLRVRTELYCICRKPYDHKPMIACDRCDEWYHFDCISLVDPSPRSFICAACKPPDTDSASLAPLTCDEDRSSTDEGLQTPPPRHTELKRRPPTKARSSLEQKMMVATDLVNILRFSSETDLLWRKSQKPLRRTARKRSEFESFSHNI
ncbi:lysine-specific demethylase JMJ17 isoform X2 [Aristolochia californica]|uniref:lysine-specific demethylase JMJ17 isoform X2 n=1 Tax=Aristolochia californica TaxID=171875 RepID=UPI0035D7E25F